MWAEPIRNINIGQGWVFIRTPRTASTAMAHVLGEGKTNGFSHHTGAELRDVLQDHCRRWRDVFSFAFVRNPWDYVVSLYWYAIGKRIVDRAVSFDRYVSDDLAAKHWTQSPLLHSRYVLDESGGLLPTFIGRYENLNADWDFVQKTIGRDNGVLPRWATHRPQGDYREYYTDETRSMVATQFANDIKAFGYEF